MHFVSFGVFGSVGFFLLRSAYAAPLAGGGERMSLTDRCQRKYLERSGIRIEGGIEARWAGV